MTEKERMLAGKLYCADDEELRREDMRKWRLLQAINRTPDPQKVRSWFRELLGSIGEPFWIQPDFYCDYGSHIHIGKHFYANYGCVMLDGGGITIGDDGEDRLLGVDRGKCGHQSGRHHRGRRGHWLRQRGDPRHPLPCSCGRKPLPGAAVHHGGG